MCGTTGSDYTQILFCQQMPGSAMHTYAYIDCVQPLAHRMLAGKAPQQKHNARSPQICMSAFSQLRSICTATIVVLSESKYANLGGNCVLLCC